MADLGKALEGLESKNGLFSGIDKVMGIPMGPAGELRAMGTALDKTMGLDHIGEAIHAAWESMAPPLVDVAWSLPPAPAREVVVHHYIHFIETEEPLDAEDTHAD